MIILYVGFPRRSFSPSRPGPIDTHEHDTAILFFSHRPEREWQNKQFVQRDYAKHRQVAEAFYQHSRRAVEESPLPVLEFNEAQQRGPDFGTRLANAVSDVLAQGYEHVIAVGSDCPRLHEVDWSAVADRLEAGIPVLGPTPDEDGTYLIGISRSQFDREAFAGLPWTSPALLPALTRQLFEQAGTAPTLLTPRDDVNGFHELLALFRADLPQVHILIVRLRAILGERGSRSGSDTAPGATPLLQRRSRAPPPLHRNIRA